MRRRLARSIVAILLSLTLAALSAALTFPNPVPAQGNLSSGAYFAQPTPSPQEAGDSEIGSTDGIVIMGGVIVIIIIVPILMRRKSWMQS